MTEQNNNKKQVKSTIPWIDIAKGLGILLVVVGHYNPINAPEYWKLIHRFVYSFHMPLFFLVSGYLYQYTNNDNYISFVRKKLLRLGLPFVFVAVAYFVIKLVASQYVELAYPVNLSSLLQLFNNPLKSYVPILWFLHALIGIFLIYPILRMFLNSVVVLIFSLLIVFLFAIFEIELLVFKNMFDFLPYFSVGVLVGQYFTEDDFTRLGQIKVSLLLLFLTIFSFAMFTFTNQLWGGLGNYTKFLPGVLGAFLLISFANVIYKKKYSKLFSQLGVASMSIYLFHTIFESTFRILMTKYTEFNFLITATISISIATLLPYLLERFLIRRSKFLSRFLLGI